MEADAPREGEAKRGAGADSATAAQRAGGSPKYVSKNY
jgi:hypothetical protein